MMLNKLFFGRKWETLVEVTIALVILSIILITTIKIIWNSKLSVNTSRDRSQAVSIAREWLETVRYIRDLNWIKYSKDKRICWNFLADNQAWWTPDWMIDFTWWDVNCSESAIWNNKWSANFIFSWSYLLLQNIWDESYSRFFVSTKWEDLDQIWSKKDNWEIYSDLDIFRLCKDSIWWITVSCESPWITSNFKWTKFFRNLKIEYIDIFWNPYNISSSPKWANHMKITSTVIWPHSTTILSVELITILSDYYSRNTRND